MSFYGLNRTYFVLLEIERSEVRNTVYTALVETVSATDHRLNPVQFLQSSFTCASTSIFQALAINFCLVWGPVVTRRVYTITKSIVIQARSSLFYHHDMILSEVMAQTCWGPTLNLVQNMQLLRLVFFMGSTEQIWYFCMIQIKHTSGKTVIYRPLSRTIVLFFDWHDYYLVATMNLVCKHD